MDEINVDEAVADISASLGFGEELAPNPPSDETTSPVSDEGVGEVAPETVGEGDVAAPDEVSGTPETPVSETETAVTPEPPPKTWRPEAAAFWDQLPPAVRAEVQKREEDMFKGIEGYKQDANIGKALKDVVAPYLPSFRAEGVDPMQSIQSLLYAHHTLVKGSDEQRREVFKHLLREYNVNLDGDASSPPVDPHLQAVQKELAEVKSYVNNSQQQQLETVKENLRRDIESFASQPENIHFNEVVDSMTQLIRSGVAKDLKDAYQQAIWLNPSVREKELSRITAEKEAARKKAEEEALQKAREASKINLRTKAKSRSGTAPTGTMDETLEETLKAIRSRTS